MFASDAFFYVGMPILTVRLDKILLFACGAHFHSGMPIFTVKMGTPDAYIHLTTENMVRFKPDYPDLQLRPC